MKVQNIQLIPQANFKNNSKKQTVSLAKESLKTAGMWLGFGLGFDYFCRRCVVFKNSPVKNSLFINSSLALLAGGITMIKGLFQSKSREKTDNF